MLGNENPMVKNKNTLNWRRSFCSDRAWSWFDALKVSFRGFHLRKGLLADITVTSLD